MTFNLTIRTLRFLLLIERAEWNPHAARRSSTVNQMRQQSAGPQNTGAPMNKFSNSYLDHNEYPGN